MASGSTLINGALKVMAWTKIKTAAVVSVALLAVGGITTMVAKKITRARQEARRALVQQEIRQAEVQLKGQQAKWHLDVWPEERKAEAEKIKARQEIDETVNATTIDLRPYINAKLTDGPSGWKGNNDDNLAELPAGKHTYAGVPFDVEGSIQTHGRLAEIPLSKNLPRAGRRHSH